MDEWEKEFDRKFPMLTSEESGVKDFIKGLLDRGEVQNIHAIISLWAHHNPVWYALMPKEAWDDLVDMFNAKLGFLERGAK